MIKFQPESVLIQLFDKLILTSDSSPLSQEVWIEINSAISEFNNGGTISWKKWISDLQKSLWRLSKFTDAI